jgi:MoaA/NifB/PqqE/SkfB family radical SAM enzyme
MTLPKTICMLPWISIEASPIGTIRPCCLAQDEIVDDDGTRYDLLTSTLEDAYNSQYMQNLRKQFLAGEQPATCSRCWTEERAGKDSKRIHSQRRLHHLESKIDWYNEKPNQLWFLDLKLGNICNLKCRICGSWSSSKWAEEDMKTSAHGDKKQHSAYRWLKQGAWPRTTLTFWDNLKSLLPNIKYIEFTGGEPWLIQEHWELLKFAVEEGHSNHIDIHYNTNATVELGEHTLVWNHFGRVDIAFSIDNVHDRFEVERYGAKWSLANKIIDDVHSAKQSHAPNITTQLCFTINIQNVYYIDELLTWADTKPFGSIYFNMLHSPDHMNIQYMTPNAKALVLDKLKSVDWRTNFYKNEIQNVINFIEQGPGSDGQEFVSRMKKMDAYRKQNFVDTHPEIAKAMGYGQA